MEGMGKLWFYPSGTGQNIVNHGIHSINAMKTMVNTSVTSNICNTFTSVTSFNLGYNSCNLRKAL
jgi:hypothetical protein